MIIKKFLDIVSQCLKIISINLNNNSFIIPSIRYTNFTGKRPKYRKNIELVDIFILNNMSKCSVYQIL